MTARHPGDAGQLLAAAVLVHIAELAGEQRPPLRPIPQALTDQERDQRLRELRRQAKEIVAQSHGRR